MGLRALMVGINDYAERPLKGCVNDTILLRDFLKTQRGVPDDQLRMYANAESTRAAIIDGLAWLAQPDADETSDAPSLRIFHYAGHGIQQADQNGDEPDGSDECLMPIDYATAGVITDDVLSELYSQFAPTTQLVLLIDSADLKVRSGEDSPAKLCVFFGFDGAKLSSVRPCVRV